MGGGVDGPQAVTSLHFLHPIAVTEAKINLFPSRSMPKCVLNVNVRPSRRVAGSARSGQALRVAL